MPNRRYQIHIPHFSEFVYRLMKRAGLDVLNRLSELERLPFKSDAAMRRFVRDESLEKLLLLSTKLGVQWILVFSPDEETAQEAIFSVFDQNDFVEKQIDIIQAYNKKNVCCIGSNDTMLYAELAAQNCRNGVYKLSQWASELPARERAMGYMNGEKIEQDKVDKELGHSVDILTNLINISIKENSSDTYLESVLGVTRFQMLLLEILYINRNKSTTISKIELKTNLINKQRFITQQIYLLMDMGLVLSDKPSRINNRGNKAYYIITGKGIQKITDYMNRVHS